MTKLNNGGEREGFLSIDDSRVVAFFVVVVVVSDTRY